MALGGEARKILVEFLGDSRELVAASREGGAAVSTFGTKAQTVGKIAGKALAGGLLIAGAGLYEAGKAAEENEASQAQLEQQLKNNTKATDEQINSTNEWIDAQAVAKGVAVDDLRPALAKLATATGDVSKAQDLLSLAMDVSAGSGKSLDQVTSALVKAQNGSVGGLARMGLATKTTAKDTAALKTAQVGVKSAQLAYTSAVKAHGKTSAEASIASDKLKIAQQKLKDAHDKTKSSTISSADAIDLLTKKYKGDAAKAADTTAGKQRVLGVEFHELSVKIGTAVIPAFQKLVEIGLKVVDFISKHTKGVGLAVAAFGGLLTVTWAVGTAMGVYAAVTGEATAATLLQKAAVGAWAVVTKAAAAAQWLFNAAMDANPVGLVVIAIAALVAGLILAYKHSETFRNIVNAAFKGIQKVVSVVVEFIKDHWRLMISLMLGPFGIAIALITKHWEAIKYAAQVVIGWVQQHWPAIKDMIVGPFQTAKTAIGDVWADIKAGFGVVRDKLGSGVTTIKNAFTTGFGAVKSVIQSVIDKVQWLVDKVQGLIDKLGALKDKAAGALSHIPGFGRASADGGGAAGAIAGGTKEQIAAQHAALDKLSAAAKKHLADLQSQLQTITDAFKSLRDSVSQAFAGDLFSSAATAAVTDAEGNVVSAAQSAAQNFITGLTQKKGTLGALKDAFKTLSGWGWGPQALASLFQSGNADLILGLAADKGLATQGAGLYGDVTTAADALGAQVGTGLYGGQIDALTGQIAGVKGGGKGNSRTAGDTYHITVNGALDPDGVAEKIEQLLHRRSRQTGRQLLVT